jgi:hypothetical protein
LVVAALSLLLSLFVLVRVRAAGRAGRSATAPRVDRGEDSVRIDLLGSQVDGIAGRLSAAEAQGKLALQKVGVVRYNPFEDTGSNQSFALAMLDSSGNGFVLSSLHSRQQTRVFLKQVTSGKAETALSDEEAEAIRRATG